MTENDFSHEEIHENPLPEGLDDFDLESVDVKSQEAMVKYAEEKRRLMQEQEERTSKLHEERRKLQEKHAKAEVTPGGPEPDPLVRLRQLNDRLKSRIQQHFGAIIDQRAGEIVKTGIEKEKQVGSSTTLEAHVDEKVQQFDKMMGKYRFGRDSKDSKRAFIHKRKIDEGFQSSKYQRQFEEFKKTLLDNPRSDFDVTDPDHLKVVAELFIERVGIHVGSQGKYAQNLITQHILESYLRDHDPEHPGYGKIEDLRGSIVKDHNVQLSDRLHERVNDGIQVLWHDSPDKKEWMGSLGVKDRQKYQSKRKKFELSKGIDRNEEVRIEL